MKAFCDLKQRGGERPGVGHAEPEDVSCDDGPGRELPDSADLNPDEGGIDEADGPDLEPRPGRGLAEEMELPAGRVELARQRRAEEAVSGRLLAEVDGHDPGVLERLEDRAQAPGPRREADGGAEGCQGRGALRGGEDPDDALGEEGGGRRHEEAHGRASGRTGPDALCVHL